MQEVIKLKTTQHEQLIDITEKVSEIVKKTGVEEGIVNVYAQGATAAIIIQENWDESVQTDLLNLLKKLIPSGIWLHDLQDNNADAHLKSAILGPSETIPIINGKLGLSRWQNIFFCEFDGPRNERSIVVTILATEK